MGVLIKNGTLVSDLDRWVGDVRCRDGRIDELGSGLLAEPGEEVVDASGSYVFPGGVDPHVHLSLPVAGTVSSDDFESGTAAALAGGTTTLIDFVHPERGQSFLEALQLKRREGEKAHIDYGLHMAVTWWGEGSAEEMASCVAAGVPTFKTYLAYKDAVGIDDGDLVQAMATAAGLDAMILVHAEHGEVVEHLRERLAAEGRLGPSSHPLSRPPEAEGEATHRAATLAGLLGTRLYVVHVTCRQSLEAVTRARQAGYRVHGETCPQYLLLDDSVYQKPGLEAAAYVIAPPIRPLGHQEALWSAIASGALEVVATDHCPFYQEQKALGRDDFRRVPGGAAGIEHRLALLYTHGVRKGRFDLHRFVELVSTRPAKLFGLYPRKGSLAVGADADLVVWDPEATATLSAATHHQRCDRTPYEGFEVRGLPAVVVVGGVVRFREGQVLGGPGTGRFLERRL
jgi:dihydropyrimidinase